MPGDETASVFYSSQAVVEVAEKDVGKEDVPQSIVDFLEPNILALQNLRDIDPLIGPADASVGRDLPDLEVGRVVYARQTSGQRPGRRHIELSGASLSDRLMGSLVVELDPEAIEAELLSPSVLLGRPGRLPLQGSMHAFVATILLGFARFDEFGHDAETDPPDRQLRDPPQGVGGERWAVVGSDTLRQAVLLEKPLEHGLCAPESSPGKPLADQQKATEAILDSEGITVAAIEGFELALEVGSPDGVGLVHGSHGSTWMRPLGPLPSFGNQPITLEYLMSRAGSWEMPVRMPTGDTNEELPGTPCGVTLSVPDQFLDNGLRDLVGAAMRSSGPVPEALHALDLEASDPLVAGGTTDAVVPAEVRDGKRPSEVVADEAASQVHG